MIPTETEQHKSAFTIPSEVLELAYNKNIAAKVLAWDSCGTIDYSPEEVQTVKYRGDILRFELTGNRAIHISASQFVQYWNRIQVREAEMVREVAQPELDVIEIEINGLVETRLGWTEENWEGEVFHHLFLEAGDDEAVWLAAYRKSTERSLEHPHQFDNDDDVAYVMALEAKLYDFAG